MDPALLREHEAFKKRAATTPRYVNNIIQTISPNLKRLCEIAKFNSIILKIGSNVIVLFLNFAVFCSDKEFSLSKGIVIMCKRNILFGINDTYINIVLLKDFYYL